MKPLVRIPLPGLVLTLLALSFATTARADWSSELSRALKNGGGYAERDDGTVLFAHRADEAFIPASTLKVATVLAALELLGPEHRFSTEFFITPSAELAVRGLGEPQLVSEDLAQIARELSRKTKVIRGIVLDTSYFDSPLRIDGASASTNPYDAANGALFANFNTVFVEKRRGGELRSAEPQTPLTPLARALAAGLPPGKSRINLGSNPESGPRYFAELLTAFLRAEGVEVRGTVRMGEVPANTAPTLVHHSSKRLDEMAQALLEYSTNFLANQLFLHIGIKQFGPPATVEKGARAFSAYLGKRFRWRNFTVAEGAGLSRKNRFTPKQLVELLKAFTPHRKLLSKEARYFDAKTGSLRGVNTLIGYFEDRKGRTIRFALLVNDTVPHTYKFDLAMKLRSGVY